MNLSLLSAHLRNNNVETVYVYAMSEECKTGVLLKLPLNGIPIDHELPGYHRGQIQAIVRAPKQAEGDALARKVQKLLTFERPVSLPAGGPEEVRINFMRPLSLPIRYPRSDDGTSIEWSINFDCCFVLPV